MDLQDKLHILETSSQRRENTEPWEKDDLQSLFDMMLFQSYTITKWNRIIAAHRGTDNLFKRTIPSVAWPPDPQACHQSSTGWLGLWLQRLCAQTHTRSLSLTHTHTDAFCMCLTELSLVLLSTYKFTIFKNECCDSCFCFDEKVIFTMLHCRGNLSSAM